MERPHDLWPDDGWGGFCAHVTLGGKLATLECEAFRQRAILAWIVGTCRCRRTSGFWVLGMELKRRALDERPVLAHWDNQTSPEEILEPTPRVVSPVRVSRNP